MLLILISFVTFQNIIAAEAGYKLLQVQAVSRHGVRERSSSNFIPNLVCSPFQRNQSITELGRIQNYLSGKGLRQTYDANFFAEKTYIPANHIFQSTDEPKTISSSQSVFQGVFYETYDEPNSTDFVNVPSYVPGPIDYALMASAICATKIDEVRATASPQQTQEWINKQSEYSTDFGTIYDATGFGPNVNGTPGAKSALTLITIPRAAEQVILAYEHGYTHPAYECVYSKTPKDLNKVAIDAATFRNKMMNRPYNTSAADGEIAKLAASPYFNAVIREFLTKTGKSTEKEMKERSFIYTAGDNANILAPIQLVGRESFGRAPFGSVFFFELYVDEHKPLPYTEADLLVKVGWRNFLIDNYNVTAYDSEEGKENHPLVTARGLAPYSEVEWYTTDLCGANKRFCTIAELRSRIYTDNEWKKQCGIPFDETDESESPPPAKSDESESESEGGLNKTGTALLCVVIILAVLLVGAVIVAVVYAVRAKIANAKAAMASAQAQTQASEKGSTTKAPAHQKSGDASVEVEAEDYLK